ncbi:MAG: STAS domain-containing protein [Cellulosilyticaceae bacterium]
MEMKCEVEKGVLLVTVVGEIDHHTSVEIRETVDREFQKKRAKNIAFDFENIQFMDSSGIGMLMGRYRNVAICGGSVGLYNVHGNIDKLLGISGVYKLMRVYANKSEAIQKLA